MSKKLVVHAALASMVLGSSVPVTAESLLKSFAMSYPKLALSIGAPSAIFLAASTFALKHQHPSPHFTQKGSWKGLLGLNKLFKSKQDRAEYRQNASDVFWTRWIGQEYQSNFLKPDIEKNGIKCSKKCLPCGVMGTSSGYLFEAKKAGEMLLSLAITYKFATDPAGFFNWIMKPFGECKECKKLSPDGEAIVQAILVNTFSKLKKDPKEESE